LVLTGLDLLACFGSVCLSTQAGKKESKEKGYLSHH
jgi:hypothetical protein